jgi:sulfur transfer protein SufE
VNGWSNTPVQRGIIVSLIEIFDRVEFDAMLEARDICFHETSGLIHSLTPLRAAGLREMIRRIAVLFQAS